MSRPLKKLPKNLPNFSHSFPTPKLPKKLSKSLESRKIFDHTAPEIPPQKTFPPNFFLPTFFTNFLLKFLQKSKNPHRRDRRAAFTLIEMLLVIGLFFLTFAILGTRGRGQLQRIQSRQTTDQLQSEIFTLQSELRGSSRHNSQKIDRLDLTVSQTGITQTAHRSGQKISSEILTETKISWFSGTTLPRILQLTPLEFGCTSTDARFRFSQSCLKFSAKTCSFQRSRCP